MDGLPFLLLFFAAWALVIWRAYVARTGQVCLVFAVLEIAAFAFLPTDAQWIPWSVLLAMAARSGWLLVQHQKLEANR